MILLNPKQHTRPYADERSAEVMRKTIAFFETKGKEKLLADYYSRVWYRDFLDFVKANRIFATMCTPAGTTTPRNAELVRTNSAGAPSIVTPHPG